MGIKLINILEDVQYNMMHGYFSRKIVDRYYIHNNLKFVMNDNIFYFAGDHKYYYFYIWLIMYGVL